MHKKSYQLFLILVCAVQYAWKRRSPKYSENRQVLGRIGCMPIVSKDYDPRCMISYTVRLIRCIKKEEPMEGLGLIFQRGNGLDVLQPLIEFGDCIDKDVITGIIDLGTNYVHDYDSAVAIRSILSVPM